ncbi:hypothetical protein GCM10020216_011340 [Nonomuraea helvata]
MTVERRMIVSRGPGGAGRPRERSDGDGDVPDVTAIVGRQLRQALLTVGAVAGLLAGVPVIAVWVPGPGAWVALSLALQGIWVGLAVLQLRRAERLER